MAGLCRSFAYCIKGLHCRNQFSSGKRFDVKATRGYQADAVAEMNCNIIEQKSLAPGHDHLPPDFVRRRFEFDPLGDLVTFILTEFPPLFSRERKG